MGTSLREQRRHRSWPEELKREIVAASLEPGSSVSVVSFDVLLYDLTSTYFESDPPFPEGDKRRHGYSRDHRGDCVQVIILNPAVDLETATGFAASYNWGEQLKPVRGAAAGRAGGPSGSV